VSAGAYRNAGERIGALGPAVVVQEGGYDLASIGSLVVAALAGLRDARR
jgi:acetoin utilization deacetylase AcuC-like enzyme